MSEVDRIHEVLRITEDREEGLEDIEDLQSEIVIDSKDVVVEIPESARVESLWILLHGHTGIGKTLFMVGLLFEVLRDYASTQKVLLIANFEIMNLPSNVEFFKSGSVRKIMERMIQAGKENVPVLVC